MIVAEINMVSTGSTGKIMFDIAETARSRGHVVYTYSFKTFRRGLNLKYEKRAFHTYLGSTIENFLHKAIGSITGFNGLFSILTTKKLIMELKDKNVEILHLHNLHHFCINLPMLFSYIKREKIRVIWTLHDCWAFTGHCAYFTMANCDRWKIGCGNCPQRNVYPKSVIDTTAYMWKKKNKWFTGIDDLTIVTPSEWLAKLVKESFLAEYPIKVINNGIDLNVFCPRESDFREKHGIC